MEQITIEKLSLKHHSASQAIIRFKEAIDDLDKIKATIVPNAPIDQAITDEQSRILRTYRNSTIKMFELSLDTTWKYIKEFLLAIHGIDRASPKDVMRSCLQQQLFSVDEARNALDMVDDRNRAAHAYKEAFADTICNKMPEYYELMKKLLDQTKV